MFPVCVHYDTADQEKEMELIEWRKRPNFAQMEGKDEGLKKEFYEPSI